MKKIFLVLVALIAFVSCENDKTPKQISTQKTEKKTVKVPSFNGDSAYYFVKAQCDFGPRVPGSMAHQQCAEWMVKTLNSYADTVFVQDFKTRVYPGGRAFEVRVRSAQLNVAEKRRPMKFAESSRPSSSPE